MPETYFLCNIFPDVRDANGAFVFLVGGILLAALISIKKYSRRFPAKAYNILSATLIILYFSNFLFGPLLAELAYSIFCS